MIPGSILVEKSFIKLEDASKRGWERPQSASIGATPILMTIVFFFLKNGPTRPLLSFFSVLSNKHHYNLTTNIREKYPSSIRCRDLNLQPSENESPPITTRPVLRPCHDNSFGWFQARKIVNFQLVIKPKKCAKV